MLKSNRLKIFVTVFLLAMAILAIYFMFKEPRKIMLINNQTIKVEVVNEASTMAKGLSGRNNLCANCGMLFVYPDYQIRNFWMKEMNFPLDIVWIRDETIVGFAVDVQPFDEQGQISRMASAEPINLVLELNSGWLKKNNVKIGDKLKGLD